MKIFEIARLHIGLLQHLEGIDVLGFITRPRLAQSCVDQLSLASQFDEVVNVGHVERADEQDGLIEPFNTLVKLKRSILKSSPLFTEPVGLEEFSGLAEPRRREEHTYEIQT